LIDFLFYNAKGNDRVINNKIKYNDKKIITYILVLKKNNYEILQWDWG